MRKLLFPLIFAALPAWGVEAPPEGAGIDAALRRLWTSASPAEKKAAQLELRAKLAALWKTEQGPEMRRVDEGRSFAPGAAGLDRLAGSLRDSQGVPEPGALGRTFDLSAAGGSKAQVGAEAGPSLAPIQFAPVVRGFPIVSHGTQSALESLSPYQRAVAEKAIPLLDRMGHSTGVYRLLRAAGVSDPRAFVLTLIKAESNFNPIIVSPAGAIGLMQVMPGTAAGYHIQGSLTDIATNIKAGYLCLKDCLLQLKRPDYALAGYNAGIVGFQRALGKAGEFAKHIDQIPLVQETHNYVHYIADTYQKWVGKPVRDWAARVTAGKTA